jgi:hypothetical protein
MFDQNLDGVAGSYFAACSRMSEVCVTR